MTITVDLVSDIVCPWCWLGWRYFDQARAQSPVPIKVKWRPYMLDPSLPDEGRPYQAYMKAKFGDHPDNRFRAMRETLEASAPDAGINFRFDEIPLRVNTLKAHMLMRWAEGQGVADAMAERLFSAFFDRLENVGSITTLAFIAGEMGMETDLVTELFETARDQESVQAEANHIRTLGINGVPTFIYNGAYGLNGAQAPQAHLNIIKKLTS